MPDCKTLTCCDEDDFPENASTDGNCPPGYYWDGDACTRCQMPTAPDLALAPVLIEVSWTLPADLNYRLERYHGSWMVLVSGVATGSLEVYDDEDVVVGTTYLYRLTVEVSEDCGYIEGEPASAQATA